MAMENNKGTEREREGVESQSLLESVRQERGRLSALVSSLEDEVWFADTQKRFILANPAALKEFGLPVSSVAIDVRELGEPLRDAAGSVVRWFGTCTDIEDMKQPESALREIKKFGSLGRGSLSSYADIC